MNFVNLLIARVMAYTINLPPEGKNGSTEVTDFVDYLKRTFNVAIKLGGLLAVLVIIYGAFLYTTSAGDETKIKEAKEYIVGAVVGFALLLLTNLIIKSLELG